MPIFKRSVSDSEVVDDEDLTEYEDYREAFSDNDTNKIYPDDFDDISKLENIRKFQSAFPRTGRHRRKLAARIKGGEFQASRRKRRLYFCYFGGEINIQYLSDELTIKTQIKWSMDLLPDVLRLYFKGTENELYKLNSLILHEVYIFQCGAAGE